MEADRIALIKSVPLFASLSGTEIQFLAEILRGVEIQAGSLLFREDEPGASFDILVDGRVEVIKALDTPDERLLAVRGPGDFFGEMSLLDPDGLHTASVRARTPAAPAGNVSHRLRFRPPALPDPGPWHDARAQPTFARIG